MLSDLHLETGPYQIPAGLEFDILVAAGDIGPLDLAVPWLAAIGKPVIYVLGNHERFGHDVSGAPARAKKLPVLYLAGNHEPLTSVFQHPGPASARQMDSRPTS